MIKVRESFELVQGFGCSYRVVRRTWLLFGFIPVAWEKRMERLV
ncbi:hypothetical protein [Haematobacter massiliensis]|nr:hypothetical protein [Haematobacter massiliensis]